MSHGKLFYCNATKGYTIKVMVDVLSGALPRTIIHLGKKGIMIRQMDTNKHIMFDIKLPREKFREYKCRKEMYVSLNLKHLQKMVRNVKKKDSMVIFVDKKKPGKLGLSIRPEGSTAQKSSRIETVYISIQNEDALEEMELPEVYRSESGETKPVYGYPMVIGATDFQKIKKMSTVGKEIVVKMQRNNYISFYSDSSVYSSELEFGSAIDDPEESESEEETDAEEAGSEELSDEEEIVGSDSEGDSQPDSKGASECEALDSEEGQEDSGGASDSGEDSERLPQGWYEATFYTSMFSLLVKLPGLCSQMQFYAPRYGYPLKIKMDAGTGNSTLGTIQVYIKDIDRINLEQDFSQERDIKGD